MSEDLISRLNSADSTEAIKALQYLAANQTYASEPKIAACIKMLTSSTDIGVRFWAKKLANSIGQYETEQANAQIAAIPKDLPVDILIQKLQSVASTYLSLDVIKKLCESKKPEALDFLKTYLTSCNDIVQISYLTKNIGIYFPSEDNLLLLVPYLKHEDDRIVANTIEGIEAIGSVKGIVILSQLLEHKSNRVRTNAAIALGKFDAEKSFIVISKMLANESGAHFKVSACHAIKTLKDERYLELLETALLDEVVFPYALAALETIGTKRSLDILTKSYQALPSVQQEFVEEVAAKIAKRLENQSATATSAARSATKNFQHEDESNQPQKESASKADHTRPVVPAPEVDVDSLKQAPPQPQKLPIYYYADKNNRTLGPVTASELHDIYQNGIVSLDTLIIQEGKSEWIPYRLLFTPPSPPPAVPPHSQNLARLEPVAAPNVATKECPFCSEQIVVSAKKCKHCGETIDVALRAAEEAKRSSSNQPMVFMNAGGGASSSSSSGAFIQGSKSRILAAALAFLFGTFGAHKFYLGRPVQGIIYFLLAGTISFAWIPACLGVFESIIYIMTTDHHFAMKYG